MTKRDRLIWRACASANERGHTLRWTRYSSVHAIGTCTACQSWVQVLSRPAPNQIDIGGPAIAVDCPATGDLDPLSLVVRRAEPGDPFTDVREHVYAIQARIVRVRPDGYTETIDVPTFFLSAHIQGITDREHAERIAVRMLQDLVGNVSMISVSASGIRGGLPSVRPVDKPDHAGTEGQDRKAYTDDQDRKSYTTPTDPD